MTKEEEVFDLHDRGVSIRKIAKATGLHPSKVQRLLVSRQSKSSSPILSTKDKLFASLRGTTFLEFNRIIGLPKKNGVEKPIYDFQMIDWINPLTDGVKRNWLKKPRGIGASEICLRFIVWMCLRNDDWNMKQVCILVTPREGLAIRQIKRIKNLFKRHNVYFDDKMTSLELNGVDISVYPGNNIAAIRSLEDPALIYADEADYWDYNQIDDVRAAIEGYIPKSDPHILLVSTPNRPRGLFQRIEMEPKETCLYRRVFWTWKTGLGTMFSEADIARMRLSAFFGREMEGEYGGTKGTTFRTELLEKCKLHIYDPDYIPTWYDKSNKNIYFGIDPGYSENSQFAISIVRINEEDNRLEVLHSAQFTNKDTPEMLDLCYELYDTYGPCNIYVDAHEVSFVRQLKTRIGDDPNWKDIAAKAIHDKVEVADKMKVVPVAFGEKGVEMLSNLRALIMEGRFAIHPKFEDLHTSLLTAVDKDLRLDKKITVFHDSLDSLRLACAPLRTDDDEKERDPLVCLSLAGPHEATHLDGNKPNIDPRTGEHVIVISESGWLNG